MTRPSLILALAAFALALIAAPAQATHVQCGDVITQDTKLDSDLIDCPANGVVIGADGITLDLNGHTIDGSGFPPGPSNGVDDSGGFDRVTIENGTIRDFRNGVFLDHVDGAVVQRIETRDVLNGLLLVFSTGNRIERNKLTAIGNGVWLAEGSNANLITRNEFTHSNIGVFLLPTDFAPPHPPELNQIERNSFNANRVGVSIPSGRSNTVVKNEVESNTAVGIDVGGFDTTVAENDLSGNGTGIQVSGQGATTVSRNSIEDSAGDGIQVSSAATGVTIERNTSSRNGDDGIDVDTANAVITKNTANFNADLGIEAVPGVTDGGGNRARGNGNPAQCVNVSCKP